VPLPPRLNESAHHHSPLTVLQLSGNRITGESNALQDGVQGHRAAFPHLEYGHVFVLYNYKAVAPERPAGDVVALMRPPCTGTLPPTLMTMGLAILGLGYNDLTGTLPDVPCNLILVRLDNNNLVGSLPLSLGEWATVEMDLKPQQVQ